jgi:hypothetical protein
MQERAEQGAAFVSHLAHQADRQWPQTNCSLDLWITYLHAKGLAPEALMGALVQIDDEGDQFTFCKFDNADLLQMHGLALRELAVFDKLQSHIATQVARGHLVMVELDGFHMPDTRATSYQREHTKTTMGIDMIDPIGRRLGYFHNSGYHHLDGADYDAIFAVDRVDMQATGTLFPYTEYLLKKQPALAGEALKAAAVARLRDHLKSAPVANPMTSFKKRFPEDMAAVIERGNEYFHIYAFNHFRQFGAVFGLLEIFARWLGDALDEPVAMHCDQIAAKAKVMQFRAARSVARRKVDDCAGLLDELAEHWAAAMVGFRSARG